MSTNTTSRPQVSSTDADPDVEAPSTTEGEPKESIDGPESNTSDNSNEQVSGTEAYDISAQTQMQFGEGGNLQPKDDTVELTLDEFDLDIDTHEEETRIDRPEASGLMADDRPEIDTRDGGTQANLFADTDETQQTLDGESAQDRCLFNSEGEENE